MREVERGRGEGKRGKRTKQEKKRRTVEKKQEMRERGERGHKEADRGKGRLHLMDNEYQGDHNEVIDRKFPSCCRSNYRGPPDHNSKCYSHHKTKRHSLHIQIQGTRTSSVVTGQEQGTERRKRRQEYNNKHMHKMQLYKIF